MSGDREEYKVKGSTILSKFEFVAERFGPDARAQLEQGLEGVLVASILTAGWYPYDLYVRVLETIAKQQFGNAVSRLVEVGAFSADAALKGSYETFMRKKDFFEFLHKLSRLHHLFYNLGELVVTVAPGQKSCDVWQKGKPRYAEADLYVALGFYTRAAELHGVQDFSCAFRVDAEGAHFSLRWS